MGEHGFSVLIEKGEDKYLFDTGAGRTLPHNLRELGKDLVGVKKVFLSHGHYDHTGGLQWLVEQLGSVEIVAHPSIFTDHMRLDPENPQRTPKMIGCPVGRKDLEKRGASFSFMDGTQKVTPDIWFITGLDPDPGELPKDDRLVVRQSGLLVPDPFQDDASLLLETDTGPMLILGCAHLGILNILEHVEEKMGIPSLHGVLGGTHLKYYGPEVIAQVIEKLEELGVDLVAVSHCTGVRATIELGKHFGERFQEGSAGSVFQF
jgi:7,8-dihydropterin-6-yl-methyl-4-(beta-D-ribofuranosyl)aminobenzene 5'-phosphate synthase